MLTYTDAYLKDLMTQDYEDRAADHVDSLGTFATEWRDKLIVFRAYEIVCIEMQADPDDLFTAKQKTYGKEFDRMLAQARIATPDEDGIFAPLFSIPLERA